MNRPKVEVLLLEIIEVVNEDQMDGAQIWFKLPRCQIHFVGNCFHL